MIELKHLKVGHTTDKHHQTGLTVFLPDQPSPCGRFLCGAAPAARDGDLLSPEQLVDRVDAILLTGGSAFGLDAASGVMQWLKENQRGWPTAFGRVPIVPSAAIYDFQSHHPVIPSPMDAYQACVQATTYMNQSGAVGAGTGASVGKLLANASPMPGGLGFAKLENDSGAEVIAFALVNCAGDVYQDNHIIAGATLNNGEFANTENQLTSTQETNRLLQSTGSNTTIVVVFTNALFDKAQLTRIARMASSGLAQAIRPAFTSYDGDMVFCLSLDKHRADEIVIGAMAAKATRLAIIHAVKGENT